LFDRITVEPVFTARYNKVPLICSNLGSPSYFTVQEAVFLSTAAVCGIWASIMASLAASVPATEARTTSFSDPSGIFAKSAGNFEEGIKVHGPDIDFAEYHRPEIRI
jgi:hypothetical protein